ncbi:PADR1 domain protein [Dictyocaulus viviparus]|uniref:NAD(+) ADP-ribosyltransferase n=1 Tax=Dictyocaulus viviparus TaxID=29172 RepID=A0A0D8XK98_DICVI|nr:PADR1 domain protein [Dictyocaulus viviparus]
MYMLRKDLKDNLSKNEMMELLAANNLSIPSGEAKLLNSWLIAPFLVVVYRVPKCEGQLMYSSTLRTYKCNGQLSEYTKCIYQDNNPKRKKFSIPKELRKNAFLKKLKVNIFSKRAYNDAISHEVIVSHSDAFKYLGSRCMNVTDKSDIEGKSMGVSSGLSRQLIKGGTVIDQECEYAEFSHVYRDNNGVVYSVVLGNVDMQTNKNSYYKLQLLKHDLKPMCILKIMWILLVLQLISSSQFLYLSFVGTSWIFLEKSGNLWSEKQTFKKLPGHMDLVETDIGDLEHLKDCRVTPGSRTMLHPAIRDVILMIFDLKQMKDTMLGFQVTRSRQDAPRKAFEEADN